MRKLIIYILLLMPVLLFSCKDDNEYHPELPAQELLVSFSIDLPADTRSNTAKEKAMEDEDEEAIASIDILAFVKDAQGVHRYTYISSGRGYTTSEGIGSFFATLKKYPQEQIFVILMNVSDELKQIVIEPDEPLGTALSKLICKNVQEWPAKINGSGNLRPIPMYATSESLTITSQTKVIGVYDLVRMLARIDISVNSAVSNFRLTKAAVFNRKTCGYIPFKAENWNSSNKEVIRADVPVLGPGQGDLTIKLPSVIYTADPVNHTITKSIYTFESQGVKNIEDATAFVVGGYFNYPQNQTIESWYRIDIPATETDYVSGDILRNFIYDIEIKSVASEGASSPESAFDGASSITVTISPWNLATNQTIFDGQYKLILSNDKVISYGEAISAVVDVTTDHPEGIMIGEIVYTEGAAGWLTVSGGDNGELERELRLVGTFNDTGMERTAEFDITAGNMVYVFKVTQHVPIP